MIIHGCLITRATTGIRVFRADGSVEDRGIVADTRPRTNVGEVSRLWLRRILRKLQDRLGAYLTIFVSTGEAALIDALDANVATWIDMGTGTGEASKGDTGVTTWGGSRGSATQSQPAADKWAHVATLAAGGTVAVTEAGLFDNSTAGALWIRSNFAAVNVVSGDSIEFTITLEAA
jgi:hypothetical protein